MLVCFTNDQVLADSPAHEHTEAEVVQYLEANPRHAVVIRAENPQYILRGASERLNNFYFGDWPAEDPNDANGGDLTASEAVATATS